MAYQETTTTSYGSRLGGAFKNIFGGILLVIVATILLCWNEGRAVKRARAINDSEKNCVEMADVTNVDAQFNGKLVHCVGNAVTTDTLRDANFGVSVNAIALNRDVEYYQWVEKESSQTRDKVGGGQETVTTYTYTLEWVPSPVSSGQFHDPAYQNKNFVYVNVEGQDWLASNVNYGAYKLPGWIVSSISGSQAAEIKMDSAMTTQWNNTIKANLGISGTINANYVFVEGNQVYFGASKASPAVGDVRVTVTYVPSNQQVSLIAKVNNDTFEEYIAKNGKTFSAVDMGNISAEQMFQSARQSNKILSWVLRIVGILLVIAGFKAMVSILPTLLKVLPFLGQGVEAITGFACTILGIVWSFVFIALAWVAYRPVVAIVLALAIVALIVLLKRRSKEAEAKMEQAPQPQPAPVPQQDAPQSPDASQN